MVSRRWRVVIQCPVPWPHYFCKYSNKHELTLTRLFTFVSLMFHLKQKQNWRKNIENTRSVPNKAKFILRGLEIWTTSLGEWFRAEQNKLRFIRHRPSIRFIPSIFLVVNYFFKNILPNQLSVFYFHHLITQFMTYLVWRHFGDETFWDNNMDVVVF